ncbi:MAG: tRNA epoxyqueuosine(34) reductase QueG [Deltaproteobacteria bacterium]|nr:tRNA epoxyqueuosine(34) reductase QueG [Deltaproteobacteria bacterium]
MNNKQNLREKIRNAATSLGFIRVGFAPISTWQRGQLALSQWLIKGCHGEMSYMAKHPSRINANHLLPNARTIIVAALAYSTATQNDNRYNQQTYGQIAKFAQGADYHIVMREKLSILVKKINEITGADTTSRVVVDTAPILEREAAVNAGIGFIAKSTMLIVPNVGSFVVLGELLTDLELPFDEPNNNTCQDCNACINTCPTGALSPFCVDARRCISYLTIESRGLIPRELRPLMGQRIFGCDICQDVCPHNKQSHNFAITPELVSNEEPKKTLTDLLMISSGDYRRWVKGKAQYRISRNQLARNAAIAIGNSGEQSYVDILIRSLFSHPSALVRQHTAWALKQIGGEKAHAALRRGAIQDNDTIVRDECI